MKRLFLLVVAVAAIMLGGAGVKAAELPSFELMGFPITSVQVQVLGAGHVEQRSPIPTLALDGMPASPHQVSVLMPRSIAPDAVSARLDTSALTQP